MTHFRTTAEFLAHVDQIRILLHLAHKRYRTERAKLNGLQRHHLRQRQFARTLRAGMDYHLLAGYLDYLLRGQLN